MTLEEALKISNYLRPVYNEGETRKYGHIISRLQEALLIKGGFRTAFTDTEFKDGNITVLDQFRYPINKDANLQYLINGESYEDVLKEFKYSFDYSLFPFYVVSSFILEEYSSEVLNGESIEICKLCSAFQDYLEETGTLFDCSDSDKKTISESFIALCICLIYTCNSVCIDKNAYTKYASKILGCIDDDEVDMSDYIDSVLFGYAEILDISPNSVKEFLLYFMIHNTTIGESCDDKTSYEGFISSYCPLILIKIPFLAEFYKLESKLKDSKYYETLKHLAYIMEHPLSSEEVLLEPMSFIDNGEFYIIGSGFGYSEQLNNPSFGLSIEAFSLIFGASKKELNTVD